MHTTTDKQHHSAPLTAWQRLMLRHGEKPLSTSFVAELSGGSIDHDRFLAAVATAMRCCAALSTSVDNRQGEPQKVAYSRPIIENAISRLQIADFSTFPTLTSGSNGLFAIGVWRNAGRLTLRLDASSLIWDMASYHNFMLCLDEAYAGEPLYPEAYTFVDHANAEAAMRLSAEHNKQRKLWREKFLPLAAPPHHGITGDSAEVRVDVTAERIDAFCAANGTNADSVFAAAYALSLTRTFRTETAAFAMVYNPRQSNSAAAYTTGPMMQPLPLAIDCRTPLLPQIAEQTAALTRNQAYGYADFALDNAATLNFTISNLGGMAYHPVVCGAACTETIELRRTAGEALALFVLQNADGSLTARAEYDSEALSGQQVTTLLRHYSAALAQLIAQ